MKEQPISFPLTNAEFLKVISNSFCRFLRVETSRSPEKLKPLHGAIAADLSRRLGEGYHVCSQGFGLGEEFTVRGRYVPKRVDITIFKQDKVAAGVAVKFVMQNYSQNSNNYFENMLGETANIRAAGYPYFQISSFRINCLIIGGTPIRPSNGGRPLRSGMLPNTSAFRGTMRMFSITRPTRR